MEVHSYLSEPLAGGIKAVKLCHQRRERRTSQGASRMVDAEQCGYAVTVR